MHESSEDAQQPRGASGVLMPLVGERLSAPAGGEAPSPSRAKALASGRNVPNRDSIADAMKPPQPFGMPAIFSVPAPTHAQRRRLRRAIESFRDEQA